MKKRITMCICFLLTVLCATSQNVLTVTAAENNTYAAVKVNLPTGNQIITIPMEAINNANRSTNLLDGEVVESYSVLLAINEDASEVWAVEPKDFYRANSSASEENTYWKATISIVYDHGATNTSFSKVYGEWTQLRGTTTLKNRYVYYALGAGSFQVGEKYPSSNSFSYNTGFSSVASNRVSRIGGRSEADVITQAGLSIHLEAEVVKAYTS